MEKLEQISQIPPETAEKKNLGENDFPWDSRDRNYTNEIITTKNCRSSRKHYFHEAGNVTT
jgi:hypothetical protein